MLFQANYQKQQPPPYDVGVVLGYPANADGTPSPVLASRLQEAVKEYRAGIIKRVLVSGGAAHNRYVEADVMAAALQRQGLPPVAIIKERHAHSTIENAQFSTQLMQQNGLKSALIITSPSHLPRAQLIFTHFPGHFTFQAAPFSENVPLIHRLGLNIGEHLLTSKLLLFGDARFAPVR